jgi:hypothetical protein
VARVILEVLIGDVSRTSDIQRTITLDSKGYEAVLSLDRNGNTLTWHLTGWKINEPDAAGEVSTQSGATQNEPTFSRSDLGAGTLKILSDEPKKSKDNTGSAELLSPGRGKGYYGRGVT